MRALLLAALLAPSVAVAGPNPILVMPGTHPSTLQLHLDDNIKLSLGNTRAAPDVWIDNTGTVVCFTSTSVDDGGTDGDIFCYRNGDNGLQFTGVLQGNADLSLYGDVGTRTVTIDDFANCATDTVTVTVNGSASVCTEADGGGANKWDAVTDNNTSATNLATCIDAISGVSATAAAAVVTITTPRTDTYSVTLAEGDATCTSLASGADGHLLASSGAVGAPAYSYAADTDTGWYLNAAGDLRAAVGGGGKLRLTTSEVQFLDDINAGGFLIDDSTRALALGSDCAAAGSTGNVCTGGTFTADGLITATAGVLMFNNVAVTATVSTYGGMYGRLTAQTVDPPGLATGSVANYWLVFENADVNTDFGHPQQTDPTIFMQSADATDITQYNSLDWNRLALGGGGGGYGCINQTVNYAEFTDGGGAVGTLVLDEGLPDGAVVQQALLHTLTGFTGDTSATIQIGDGTTVDRYNTGTPDVFVTNASGVSLGAPSGTTWHDAAVSVTVTITTFADWTSVGAGDATILICYWTP